MTSHVDYTWTTQTEVGAFISQCVLRRGLFNLHCVLAVSWVFLGYFLVESSFSNFSFSSNFLVEPSSDRDLNVQSFDHWKKPENGLHLNIFVFNNLFILVLFLDFFFYIGLIVFVVLLWSVRWFFVDHAMAEIWDNNQKQWIKQLWLNVNKANASSSESAGSNSTDKNGKKQITSKTFEENCLII